MGKRKQRKTQEENKVTKKGLDNQENQQVKGNQQTPSKIEPVQAQKQNLQVQCSQKEEANYRSLNLKQVQSSSKDYSTSQNAEPGRAPTSYYSHRSDATRHHETIVGLGSIEKETNSRNRIIQKENDTYQAQQHEQNLKTLLHSQKQLINQNHAHESAATSKVLQKNEQNSLTLQHHQQQQQDNAKRVIINKLNIQQQEYYIEGEFDSGLDEDDYGEEYEEDQTQLTFQQFQKNLNAQTSTATNNNYNFSYDEVEATQYTQNIVEAQMVQGVSNHQPFKNLNSLRSRQLEKDIQKFSMETFIQADEQLQSDIKFCLYCIYNNHDIAQYFKQLLRIQKKLKEWSFQLKPKVLFSIFEENIKEFMQGIRDKLIEEMKQLQMIRQKGASRRQSFDDYFLIDKTFTRSYSLHGYTNEILNHYMKYMSDQRYEQIRNDIRYRIWSEMRKNNEMIVSFYQHPDAYQKIFDLLIKFYTKVRDSILGIEEMWLFFMESVFQQELKGSLIFDQLHKQIFKKDILSHRYIQSFLKEINEVQIDLENRRQNNQSNNLDPIIENISQILFELDEDLNYQYQNEVQQDQHTQDTTEGLVSGAEEIQDDALIDDPNDTEMIVTYEQLQESQKLKYGGQTLAQQVNQYSSQTSNSRNIYRSIQAEKRYKELMDNLPYLDTETLCYFIENNNLTREEYEEILLSNQQKANNVNGQGINQEESINDELIISPSKNLNFLSQYFQNANEEQNNNQINYQNYSLGSNEDDDDDLKLEKQLEKKKKKNLKKKRKRKEKKQLAQHQSQLEEMLKLKLLEEQQKRQGQTNEQIRNQLRQKLIECMGINANSHQLNIRQEHSKKSHSDSSQNDLQTKKTQCDENSDHEMQDAHESEFEKDLQLFRERLEKTNQSQHSRQRQKLVPNISEGWLDSLKERLRSYYQCQSPKSNAGSIDKKEFGQHSEALWVKSYQRSA